MKNSKNVLITGTNGFVGRNLLSSLSNSYSIKCLVRDNNFKSRNAEVFYFHTYNDESIEKAVSNSEIVIHCAAMLHGKKKPMWNANFNYTKRLLNLSEKYSISHFLFISTENVKQGLRDGYTTTKKAAEEEVKRFKNHTILRPTVLYGPGDKKYVTRLIHIIRSYPFIPIIGNGTNRFQFLYIDDLVNVIASSLNKKIYGTYLIAGLESITYNDFINKILHHLNIKKPVVRLPILMLKPLSYFLDAFLANPPITPTQLENIKKDRNYDISEIIRLFDYTPTSLDTGLKKLIAKEK